MSDPVTPTDTPAAQAAAGDVWRVVLADGDVGVCVPRDCEDGSWSAVVRWPGGAMSRADGSDAGQAVWRAAVERCEWLYGRDDVAAYVVEVLAPGESPRAELAHRAEQGAVDTARIDRALATIDALTRERDRLTADLARLRALFAAGESIDVAGVVARLRAATAYCERDCAKPVSVAGGDVVNACDAIEHLARHLVALAARVTAAEAAAAFATGERDAARSIAAGFREQCDLALAVAGEAQAARDAAEAQRAALAVARKAVVDASARYGAAWDAVLTMPPTAAQSEEIAAALRVSYEAQDALSVALDALLRGAPSGYVRASVVREYLAAVETEALVAIEECAPREVMAWRARYAAAMDARDATRTALDAALAAAGAT